MSEAGKASSGVQALIDRVRDQGIESGREQAQRLVAEAHEQAAHLVREAEERAERLLRDTHEQIEAEKRAAQDALELAVRDAILALKTQITTHFADRMKRLVSMQMADRELLNKLVLEVAQRARPADLGEQKLEVELLTKVIGVDELRSYHEEVKEGTLTHFVLAVSGEMLRDGVELTEAKGRSNGMRVRLSEGDIELDLSDEAVTELLLQHLLPRFRALLEGIVR